MATLTLNAICIRSMPTKKNPQKFVTSLTDTDTGRQWLVHSDTQVQKNLVPHEYYLVGFNHAEGGSMVFASHVVVGSPVTLDDTGNSKGKGK